MSRNAHRTPAGLCPHCGYLIDAATGLDGEGAPEPGDWSMCLRCGAPLRFGLDRRPELPALGAFEALQWEAPEVFAKLVRGRELVQREARRGDWIPDRGGRA